MVQADPSGPRSRRAYAERRTTSECGSVSDAGFSPRMRYSSRAGTRLPAGHPAGFIEAFAQIYRDFAADLRQHLCGEPVT